MKSSKIIRMQAENVKRLSAVEITPDGNVVIVGGDNGAGKSSVLDSIAFALGGKGAQCEIPLRAGEKKGYTVVETDDIVVKRTFTEGGGGTLRVLNKQGMEYKSPQKILDAMVGTLAFDPLAFMRLKPKEQADALRELFGIDVSDIELRLKQIYDERTIVNRQARDLEGKVRDHLYYEDAPKEEISTAALLAELDTARTHNGENNGFRGQYADHLAAVGRVECEVQEIDEKIGHLKAALALAKAAREELLEQQKSYEGKTEALKAYVDQLVDIDLDPIRERMKAADNINRRVRVNIAYSEKASEMTALHEKANDLTLAIQELDNEKTARFESANLPVPGLTVDEGRVLFNGLPLSQCSQAEQLRISVAMGMAQKSNLRVMLIREGSFLDANNMALLKQLAEEHDAQIWLEVVGDRDDCSVVIEDGSVRRMDERLDV